MFFFDANEMESMKMKRIETVSLIGLGAVGSSYLAKMAETVPMENLRIIASEERAERYRKNGVLVNGKSFYFPVYEPDEEVAPADLLIFAVKNNHLDQAVAEAKKHAGPETVILSLLNGVISEQVIAAEYGAGKVLYSYVMGIDATRMKDSTIYEHLGYISFGEEINVPGAYSEKTLAVDEFFTRTGISYKIPENMIKDLWLKFMLNVGANQVTAVLRCPYGGMQKMDGVRSLVVSAMEEAAAVSYAENICLGKEEIEICLAILDKLSPSAKTSMLQDVEAGRKTEVDVFGGTVLSLGRKHGIPVPVNEMLVRLIKALEETFSL